MKINKPEQLACPKHNRILIGKGRCVDCTTEKAMEKITKMVGDAYKKARKIELSMGACPKCQFEQFKNGICGHCGFQK